MPVNYTPPKPVAGASRATAPTEVDRWSDYADTIADVNTRLDTVESATSSRARAGMSAALSIATGVITVLDLDTEAYDTDALHSTTTNPSRITFHKAGAWLVTGQIAISGGTTGRRIAIVRKNAAEVSRALVYPTVASVAIAQTTSVVTAVAGDYVDLAAFQDSGSALNTDPNFLYLSAIYIGA